MEIYQNNHKGVTMTTKIKQPTVTEKWAAAQEIMNKAEISAEVQTLLEVIYAPKSASSVNPPLEEDGEITAYWDRWFNQYVTVEESVLSNGKPKGYSKASISLWNKYFAETKELWEPLMEAGLSAKEIKSEIEMAKKSMNSPESFDYDRDTKRFNNKTKIEVSWDVDDKKWITTEI